MLSALTKRVGRFCAAALDEERAGITALAAPPGFGKTTALRALAAQRRDAFYFNAASAHDATTAALQFGRALGAATGVSAARGQLAVEEFFNHEWAMSWRRLREAGYRCVLLDGCNARNVWIARSAFEVFPNAIVVAAGDVRALDGLPLAAHADARALALTVEEAEELVRDWPANVPAAEILGTTDGSIAAFATIARAFADGVTVPRRATVWDVPAAVVWTVDRFAPETSRRIRALALLDRFDPAWMAMPAKPEELEAALASLRRAGLFEPAGGPLWSAADFAREALEGDSTALAFELLELAAAAERNGFHEAALLAAQASGDLEALAGILERRHTELLASDYGLETARAVETVSAPARDGDGIGRARIALGRYFGYSDVAQRLSAAAPEPSEHARDWDAVFARYRRARFVSGDASQARLLLHEITTAARVSPSNAYRWHALVLQYESCVRGGDLAEAFAIADVLRANAYFDPVGADESVFSYAQAQCAAAVGDPRSAVRFLDSVGDERWPEELAASVSELRATVKLALEPGRTPIGSHAREADRSELRRDAVCAELIGELDRWDAATGLHAREVAAWAGRIARHLGFDGPRTVEAMRTGLLHDVGKTVIPREVLNAPRRLRDDEWALMKTHAIAGAHIVEERPEVRTFAGAIAAHHERYDGTGYPQGLRGDAIPMYARIASVADAFNAMIADRPYSAPRLPDEALGELVEYQGRQHDPTVVEAMRSVVRRALARADAPR